MKRDEEKPARVGQAFLCGNLVVGLAIKPSVNPSSVRGICYANLNGIYQQTIIREGVGLIDAVNSICFIVLCGCFIRVNIA